MQGRTFALISHPEDARNKFLLIFFGSSPIPFSRVCTSLTITDRSCTLPAVSGISRHSCEKVAVVSRVWSLGCRRVHLFSERKSCIRTLIKRFALSFAPRCDFAGRTGLGGRIVRSGGTRRGGGTRGERVGDASRVPLERNAYRRGFRARKVRPAAVRASNGASASTRRGHGVCTVQMIVAAPRIRVVCCLRCARGSIVGVTTAQRAAHRRTSRAAS